MKSVLEHINDPFTKGTTWVRNTRRYKVEIHSTDIEFIYFDFSDQDTLKRGTFSATRKEFLSDFNQE